MSKEYTNNDITNSISKICSDSSKSIERVLSHIMKRYFIVGLEILY